MLPILKKAGCGASRTGRIERETPACGGHAPPRPAGHDSHSILWRVYPGREYDWLLRFDRKIEKITGRWIPLRRRSRRSFHMPGALKEPDERCGLRRRRDETPLRAGRGSAENGGRSRSRGPRLSREQSRR